MIHLGDCVTVMAGMEPESVDAIVTDPPYGLGFMGKAWDDAARLASVPPSAVRLAENGRDPYPKTGKGPSAVAFDGRAFQSWCESWGRAAYRVARPSAYLLAFGGTRTVHRMTVALEDAGWIIRDMLVWGYASGFPKSKASLKPAWEPIVMARKPGPLRMLAIDSCRIGTETTATVVLRRPTDPGYSPNKGNREPGVYPNELPGRWPANIVLSHEIFEPGVPGVVIAGSLTGTMTAWSSSPDSEPYPIASTAKRADRPSSPTAPAAKSRGSATANVGTQLDAWATSTDTPKLDTGCSDGTKPGSTSTSGSTGTSGSRPTDPSQPGTSSTIETVTGSTTTSTTSNSSPEPSTPDTTRPSRQESSAIDGTPRPEASDPSNDGYESWNENSQAAEGYSRYFLIPKAARSDREPVLGGLPRVPSSFLAGQTRCVVCDANVPNATTEHCGEPVIKTIGPGAQRANSHPTVKPTDLMRHLVRLVTPVGGIVLDPFLGSGTTALAAEMEGFDWIGIERELEYVAIAEARLNGTQRGMAL